MRSTAAFVGVSTTASVTDSMIIATRRRRRAGPSTSPRGGSAGLRQCRSSAAWKVAVSRTVLVTTPSLTILIGRVRAISPSMCLPLLGLSPTSPAAAAGIRIDPPPSLACAIGTAPAATSAAAPPEDAPTEWRVFQGLGVGGPLRNSVVAFSPNSGIRLLPSTVIPALRNCVAYRPSCVAGRARNASDPWLVGIPTRSVLSLSRVGTPWSRPVSASARRGAS